jgi:predicted O-methyltransferase YrrM
VISIEGCHETARLAKSNLEDLNISNASICVGDIGNVLDSILEENSSPGLVFIDANHSEEPLKEYFGLILKHIDEDTVVAIDDIHLNASMERGWQSILGSERISSSIDLFSMGIVFFRKGIARQDYVIRY